MAANSPPRSGNGDHGAVLRLLEAVDLLGKISASLSERVDNQGRKIDGMATAINQMQAGIGEVKLATSPEMTERIITEGVAGSIDDLSQLSVFVHDKIRQLSELQTELKEILQQSESSSAALRRDRWVAVGCALLIFATGWGVGFIF